MDKLNQVVKETLMSYSERSGISVMMFGHDKEIEQIISDHPSAYFITFHDAYHAGMASRSDIMICTANATKEEINHISELVSTEFSDTVIIEESESGKTSKRHAGTIHQNKYNHFTYLDNKTPHIVIYSNTSEVIYDIQSFCYDHSDMNMVSTLSAPLTDVPFTIFGGIDPLDEPDDVDDYLFGLDSKGDEN